MLPGNGFSVVSQSFDGRNAVETVKESRAQIVLCEIRLPKVNGLKMLDSLGELDVLKVIYTSDTNPTYLAKAAAIGVDDYVLKTDPVETLISSLQKVSGQRNGTDTRPVQRNHLFQQISNRLKDRDVTRDDAQNLTNREAQVLRHLGFGLSNREIARSLGISVETVKEHVQNILRKLDCKDRTAAAVWAVRQGLS